MAKTLQGMDHATATPMDLVPELVGQGRARAEPLRPANPLSRLTNSGQLLPGSDSVQLIDTRALASSLQVQLGRHPDPGGQGAAQRRIDAVPRRGRDHDGDLQQLLDHQLPRMAIPASGGSPARPPPAPWRRRPTAAMAMRRCWSTESAVHLVGPGGEEWWIEGDDPVADQASLQARYPQLDPAHFIGRAGRQPGGLNAQDVLDAVVVSMGTMGVVYSVVLEVVPAVRVAAGRRTRPAGPTCWRRGRDTEGDRSRRRPDREPAGARRRARRRRSTGPGSPGAERLRRPRHQPGETRLLDRQPQESRRIPDDANSPAPAVRRLP